MGQAQQSDPLLRIISGIVASIAFFADLITVGLFVRDIFLTDLPLDFSSIEFIKIY
jgi:hypothetical protein